MSHDATHTPAGRMLRQIATSTLYIDTSKNVISAISVGPLAFFGEMDIGSRHLKGPLQAGSNAMHGSMVPDHITLGWCPLESSIFDEPECGQLSDDELEALPLCIKQTYGMREHLWGRDIVASIAGAPHTMSTEQAVEMYRTQGWYDSQKRVAPRDIADQTNVALLYRPTVILHDATTPKHPLAAVTGELRVEAAGASGTIVSCRLLGIAAQATDRSMLLVIAARAIGQHLADTFTYAKHEIATRRHLINPDFVQSSTDSANLSPAELAMVMDEFGLETQASGMCVDIFNRYCDDDGTYIGPTFHHLAGVDPANPPVDNNGDTIDADTLAALVAFAHSGKCPEMALAA